MSDSSKPPITLDASTWGVEEWRRFASDLFELAFVEEDDNVSQYMVLIATQAAQVARIIERDEK